MPDLVILLVKIGCGVLAGILAGNAAVYVFNRMPAKWLCDYGEEPGEELRDPYTQRIKGWPWRWVFSGFFVAGAIRLAIYNWQFAPAAVVACWALLLVGLADKKYGIIPDQLVILIAISAVGFVPHQSTFWQPLLGLALGGGVMLFMALAGKLLFKKEALGFGDVKLFAALGLAAGFRGTAMILILSVFMSCAAFTWGLLRKTLKKDDMKPLGPYIAAAAMIYLVIIWPLL